MWIVTGLDDFVVERTWRALRRGDHTVPVRAWGDLVSGFPGCAITVLAVAVALVAWLLLR